VELVSVEPNSRARTTITNFGKVEVEFT